MSRSVIIASVAVAIFATLVAIENLQSGDPFSWLSLLVDVFEMALLAGAVVLTAMISTERQDMKRAQRDLMQDLDQAKRDGAHWRAAARAHVEGLSRAMTEQFGLWGLTESEQDVAILMLKGLSHKEIAVLRDSKETTVRQHAAAVYRKSGLVSRAQLTGFFLEDLLAPTPERRLDVIPMSDPRSTEAK